MLYIVYATGKGTPSLSGAVKKVSSSLRNAADVAKSSVLGKAREKANKSIRTFEKK